MATPPLCSTETSSAGSSFYSSITLSSQECPDWGIYPSSTLQCFIFLSSHWMGVDVGGDLAFRNILCLLSSALTDAVWWFPGSRQHQQGSWFGWTCLHRQPVISPGSVQLCFIFLSTTSLSFSLTFTICLENSDVAVSSNLQLNNPKMKALFLLSSEVNDGVNPKPPLLPTPFSMLLLTCLQASRVKCSCYFFLCVDFLIKSEINTRDRNKRCITSVTAVCWGQTQATLQEVQGRQQALCVRGLQHPTYAAH